MVGIISPKLQQACDELYERYVVDQSGAQHRAVDLAGNGRFIRNIIEAAEEEREFHLATDDSIDLAAADTAMLMRIEAADMQAALDGVLSTLR
jgi:hypothetical protein